MVEWEADEADQLVVSGSDPVPADTSSAAVGQTTGQQQAVGESVAEVAEGPIESQVTEPEDAAPLGFHYTPPGTGPISDDVDAPMDDLTRSLASMDFSSMVGQLYGADSSVNENITMAAVEVRSQVHINTA